MSPAGDEGRWVRRDPSGPAGEPGTSPRGTPGEDARPPVTGWSVMVFAAEVLAWVGVGMLAFRATADPAWRWPVALAAVVVALVCWGLFASSRARMRTPDRQLVVRVVGYLLGVVGWLVSGAPVWAVLCAVLAAIGEGGASGARRRG